MNIILYCIQIVQFNIIRMHYPVDECACAVVYNSTYLVINFYSYIANYIVAIAIAIVIVIDVNFVLIELSNRIKM